MSGTQDRWTILRLCAESRAHLAKPFQAEGTGAKLFDCLAKGCGVSAAAVRRLDKSYLYSMGLVRRGAALRSLAELWLQD